MPANTPRPIGRTSSFFPGSVKGVADAEASAAAAEALMEVMAEEAVEVADWAGAALADTVPVADEEPVAVDATEETATEPVLVDVP